MNVKKTPSRREALEMIITKWNPARATETVTVWDAIGRVTASEVAATVNIPVVRASAMDGIGVDSTRFQQGIPDTSRWVQGVDYVRADTGDDFSDLFDSVIAIEAVEFTENGGVQLADNTKVTRGMNVRERGSSIKTGDLIVPASTRLRPIDLAALTAGGVTTIDVVKRPIVAFIPTGSELVPAGNVPERGQTIDCNSVFAYHSLCGMCAEPKLYPIIGDDPALLREAILSASQDADIVLVGGGSSKGGEDYTAALIEDIGEPLFHWIASAPGRPLCAAMMEGKPLINIPGPPLANYFVFDWCVSALINHYYGARPRVRAITRAKLVEKMDATPGMEILRKFGLRESAEGYEAIQLGGRGGGMLAALTSPLQFVSDGGNKSYEAGDVAEFEFLM